MGFRSIWVRVGVLAAVVTAIVVFGVARQLGEPMQEQRDVQAERDTLAQAPESGRPQSADDRVADKPYNLLAGQEAGIDDGMVSVDRLRSPDPASASALDHETGWPYATRI